MPQRAIGLPDPTEYGSMESLRPGSLVPWVIQLHNAARAGKHRDIRFGRGMMHSFATKKELPVPGEKRMLYQQPLHEEAYKTFEGRIPSGYGKGTVKKQVGGEILITSVGKDKVVFTTASEKHPQRFALIRSRHDPKAWIMANVTPTQTVEQKKVHYIKIPDSQVQQVLNDEFFISPKVDGAAAFYRLAKGKLEALSYRTSKTGKPIVHTERLGLIGHRPKTDGETLLRGEIYGERGGEAIPPQELGGILNATIQKAMRKQRAERIQMKNLLFGVRKFKGKDIPSETPWPEQEKMLQEAMQELPANRFMIAPMLRGGSPEAKALFERIRAGEEPLTEEGIVALPVAGGRPRKVKFRPESDVWIRSVFPGAGKLLGRGAGGFRYSLTPKGPIVGKVGTGLSEETRREMHMDPDSFIGRLARIAAQEQFPSGAYRAPSLLGLHEDYPIKAAAVDVPDVRQYDQNDCGGAAVLALTGANNPEERGDKIDRELGVTDEGTSPARIMKALQSRGLSPIKMKLTVPMLKTLVGLGIPVIVDVQAWPENSDVNLAVDDTNGHYMIAIGASNGRIVFEDPSVFGRVYLSDAQLLERWHDGENKRLGIVVLGYRPAESAPRSLKKLEQEDAYSTKTAGTACTGRRV